MLRILLCNLQFEQTDVFLAPVDDQGSLLGISETDCAVTLTARLVDVKSEPVTDHTTTKVRLEIRMDKTSLISTTPNTDGPWGDYVDAEGEAYTSLTVLMAGPDNDGVFTADVALREKAQLEFVVMVETFDEAGNTEDERRIPWRGTQYGIYAEHYEWNPLVTHEACAKPGDTGPPSYWLVVSNENHQRDRTGSLAHKFPECTRSDART